MSNIRPVGSDNFDAEVLQAEGSVLVDFYADWCGPCQAQAQILESLSLPHDQAVSVVKVDVDQEPALAQQYGVRGIPTLVLFRNGKASAVRAGVSTQAELAEMIAKPGNSPG